MLYRYIGNTGIKASILGFGCMRLPMRPSKEKEPPKNFFDLMKHVDEEKSIEMIHFAIKKEVNYFDSAYMYHGGVSETVLGKAIRGFRDKLLLATKSPTPMIQKSQDFDRILDEQLSKLQTSYLDFYLLHGLGKDGWEKVRDLGALDFLDRAKKDGRIRKAGFSFHDKFEIFADIIDAYPWDMCQIQYNYFDVDHQAGKKGLQYAASKGIGIVIMEPLRGGRLTDRVPPEVTKIWYTAPKKRSPAEWALRWVWNHPEVSVVLSGMSNMDQVVENIAVAEDAVADGLTSLEIDTIDRVADTYRSKFKVDCTGCEYCLPCPNGVNIPWIFSLYNDQFMFESREMGSRIYSAMMPADQRADNCIECGECEEKCPQQIEIIENLKQAHQLLYQDLASLAKS